MSRKDDIEECGKKWEAIGMATGPGDHAKAEAAVAAAYRIAGHNVPDRIVWAPSVWAGLVTAARERHDLPDDAAPSGEQLRNALSDVAYGQPDAPWLAKIDFVLRHEGPTHQHYAEAQRCEPMLDLALAVSWWWPYDDIVILAERPSVLSIDADGDLHGESGPAIAWSDGFGLYFWHGVPVPATAIEHPDTFPASQVINEANAEVRRALVEKIGWERIVDALHLQTVHSDEYGMLLRSEARFDEEQLTLVKVVNSTAEGTWILADGERTLVPQLDGDGNPVFKDYYLRVPPTMRTAREAVAWTFNMREDEYDPVQQT